MKKTTLYIIIAFIAGLLIGYGMGKHAKEPTVGENGNGDGIKAETNTIKIGVIGPLTGALAQYGEANKNGLLLATKDFDVRGKKIEFIFEDSQYDTTKAISAYRKLVDINKVKLVIDWGSATSYGIAPLAETEKIPFIAISIDPDVAIGKKYVIRHLASPDDIAQKLWEYFRDKRYKNIGIDKLEILYFNKIIESLQKLKRPDEAVIVIDTYLSFNDRDFRTSISKIKLNHAQYDTLGIFLAGGQIVQFYKQLNQLGLSLPTFGTDFFESYTEIADAGGLMDGAIYANIGTSHDFVEKYKTEFMTDNQVSFAGLSYDLGGILATKVDFSNQDSILSSLRAIKDYRGNIGPYIFSEEGGDNYLMPTLFIKEIQGNTINIIR